MVCFTILLSYPCSERAVQNTMNEKKLEYLRRHHKADFVGAWIDGGIQFFQIVACGEDAVSILRDVPSSIHCISVNILRSETLLYSYSKVTHQRTIPPHDLLLKKVYWAASQLERRHQDLRVSRS